MTVNMQYGKELEKIFDKTYEQSQLKEHEQKLKHYSDFREELEKRRLTGNVVRGDMLPWRDDAAVSQFRLRPAELTIWSGYNFTGKSLLVGQIAASLAVDMKVAIASFEMNPIDTLDRIQRQCLIKASSSNDIIDLFYSKLNLWIYAHNENMPVKTTIGMAQYMAQQGNKHLFIDSLMMCTDDDDYNSQKQVIQELRAVAIEYQVHIHLVAHNKKPPKPGHKPTRHDILGGSGIANNADNIVIMDAEDPDNLKDNPSLPTHYANVNKHRNGKYKGTISFYLNEKTLQFKRSLHDPDHDYLGVNKYFGGVRAIA